MKKMLVILFGVAGILFSLWLGLWVLFIGGVVSIVDGFKADPTNAMWIATGILRVILGTPVATYGCLVVGWITCDLYEKG